MTATKHDRIKCKFCDWSTVKQYSKGGKFRNVHSAHQRLLDHVHEFHRAEYEQVQTALESLDREI